MKMFTRLLISLAVLGCLAASAPAQNRLKDKPEATTPAADDWLYLDGAVNGVRKLSPTYYAIAAALNASNLTSGTIPDARFPSTLPALNASLLTALNASALASGTVPNARLDADLQTFAGITPSANVQTLLGAADYAAFKTSLSLNNVDNTSDANKPVSTATQEALDLKAPLASPALTGAPSLATATATSVVASSYLQGTGYGLFGTATRGYANAYSSASQVAGLTLAGSVWADTTGEHTFKNSWAGNNTLAVWNTSTTGFSAVRFLRQSSTTGSGDERAAIGWGNPSTGAFAQTAYFEASNYVLADGSNVYGPVPRLALIQTGTISSTGTGASYVVLEAQAATGNLLFFDKSNSNATTAMDKSTGYWGFGYNAGYGSGSPKTQIDVAGLTTTGNGSRGSDATFNLNVFGSDGNMLRLVKPSVVKADFTITGTGVSRALNVVDTDNSSVIPLSISLAGTRVVTVGGMLANHATAGIGYTTGAGGTVTQVTSRTTGVALNKASGAITLVSAAGSTSWQTFTVTNSVVATTDIVTVNQKSGTDLYEIHVTAVGAGSFNISFRTTGGTTTEQPVFSFAVIKGATS